jgi:L-alanine-DL-glutamate epimerase-like enolase superfamily enzyme
LAYRDRVPLYSTCPPQTITTVEDVEGEVRKKQRDGYVGIKLQLSGGSKRDIPRLWCAREAAGLDYPLMVDSSAILSFEDALKTGDELDDLKFEWFEGPFPDDYLIQLKKLADSIRTLLWRLKP